MGMTLEALLLVIVVAVLVGIGVQYFVKPSFRYEWLVVAVAVAFGAYFASESFPGSYVFQNIQDWGPSIGDTKSPISVLGDRGLFIIPAIVGAAILGIIADLGVRMSLKGTTQVARA